MADENDTRAKPDEAAQPADAGTATDSTAGAEGGTASNGASPGASEAGGAETAASGSDPRLQEALTQLESLKDQALRSQAEAENTRRRAARDVENAHKFALERFAAELLPVIDSLEKAVEVASEAEGAESIAEGVELSLKLFVNVLDKHGVEQIDPAGEPFDPQLHEAMAVIPSDHAEPNSVIEVMQRGYRLNGRLVRAAKVVVARAPDGGQGGGR